MWGRRFRLPPYRCQKHRIKQFNFTRLKRGEFAGRSRGYRTIYTKGVKKPLLDLMRVWKGIKELPPDNPRSFFMRLADFFSRQTGTGKHPQCGLRKTVLESR